MPNSQWKQFRSGQAMMTAVLFLLFASVALLFSFSSIALRETRASRVDVSAKQSYFLNEAGVEDVVYRIERGKQYAPTQTVTLNGASATVAVATVGGQKVVSSSASISNAVRRSKVVLLAGDGVSFHYGVQIGDGGIEEMGNGSTITGDVFSTGDIRGNDVNKNTITGSAQVTDGHSITGITVTQNAYAGTFSNCTIGGTAYYVTSITGCNAPRTSVLAQPIAPIPFPITQAQINDWKADAAVGVPVSGYTINSSTTIGPQKIIGDLTIGNNITVTIAGTIWVAGTINFGNSDTIQLASSYGTNSGVIIIDGRVDLGNTITFSGTGQTGSYLMLLSTYSGSENAIKIGNSASSAIFYAPGGAIEIGNGLTLHELTAYKLEVGNGSSITYQSGLANLNFTSGPTGGWNIKSWNEVK